MSRPVADDSRIGSELAGYRIEALLGRGGMGVVYLAKDLRLGRRVALKLLTPELAQDERFRERFLRESRVAASLDHSSIVPIYEAGEAEGVLFIAMRYVEGTDLRAILEADALLEPSRTLALLGQVAEALDAAHAHELVHRDVKPANVLIALEGGREHCYLADFGLTKRVSPGEPDVSSEVGVAEQPLASESLSQTGQVFGTADYVAPEQIRGEPVDGRADIYSLGCVLVECLTGEVPFPADRLIASMFAHLEGEPPSLHARRPELPEAIDAVISRALAKSPDDRHATCRELVEAAREALGISRPVRWRTALLASLLGAVLVAAGLLAFFLVRGDGASLPTQSGDTLVRIDPATNEVVATIPVGKNPSAAAIGESGIWVANRDDGTVSRIDPQTNEVELEAPTPGAPADVTVSARHVVVTTGPLEAGIAVIDGATGAEEDVFSLAAGSFFGSPSVTAGESGVWVATGDRRVGRLSIVSGTLVDPVVIPQPPDERADAVFSGIAVDRNAVWVIGDPVDRRVWRIDSSTGELVATISLPFAPKDVAAGAGWVWVTSQLDDTLSRIDPATNGIAGTVPVGRGAAGVAVGAGSIWIANAVEGTVSRVDPRTLQVETIDVDGYPDEVAVSPDAVWVTAHG